VYALQPEPFDALLQTCALLVYKVMRALFRTTHSNLMRMNMESRDLTNHITRSRGRYWDGVPFGVTSGFYAAGRCRR